MAVPRESRILKEVEAQGWTVVETKNGYRFLSPDGIHTASMHRTPSDHRWFRNLLRDLRAGGFNPPKGWS